MGTASISWLRVKEALLHDVSGPSQAAGRTESNEEVSLRKRNSASRLQYQLCRRRSDLPAQPVYRFQTCQPPQSPEPIPRNKRMYVDRDQGRGRQERHIDMDIDINTHRDIDTDVEIDIAI